MQADGLGDASGLVKYDLTSPDKAVAATLRFGEGRTGGEAVFVPSSTNAAELDGETDDSWTYTMLDLMCRLACKNLASQAVSHLSFQHLLPRLANPSSILQCTLLCWHPLLTGTFYSCCIPHCGC